MQHQTNIYYAAPGEHLLRSTKLTSTICHMQRQCTESRQCRRLHQATWQGYNAVVSPCTLAANIVLDSECSFCRLASTAQVDGSSIVLDRKDACKLPHVSLGLCLSCMMWLSGTNSLFCCCNKAFPFSRRHLSQQGFVIPDNQVFSSLQGTDFLADLITAVDNVVWSPIAILWGPCHNSCDAWTYL